MASEKKRGRIQRKDLGKKKYFRDGMVGSSGIGHRLFRRGIYLLFEKKSTLGKKFIGKIPLNMEGGKENPAAGKKVGGGGGGGGSSSPPARTGGCVEA